MYVLKAPKCPMASDLVGPKPHNPGKMAGSGQDVQLKYTKSTFTA